jgi:hypothetical protein
MNTISINRSQNTPRIEGNFEFRTKKTVSNLLDFKPVTEIGFQISFEDVQDLDGYMGNGAELVAEKLKQDFLSFLENYTTK